MQMHPRQQADTQCIAMMQARASKAAAAAAAAATKRVPLKPAGSSSSSSRAVRFLLRAACSFGLRRRPAGAVFYPPLTFS